MKDNLFKSLRGVTISALTKLLLSFDVWGEIKIIWQKDKVVASRPRAAKCPRQHTKHFRWTLNSGRGQTAHSVRRGLRAPARWSSDPHGR